MTSRRVRVATTGAPARATGLSLAVVLLALAAVAAVTVLHVLRDDVDPLRQMMSEYANGRLGVVMTVSATS
jgi:di/tricarboxylate transporter